jgi:hypothetical protein
MALTQTQLADAVAEQAGVTRTEAKNVLTALEEVILSEIGNAQKVKIGNLVQLTVRLTRAREDEGSAAVDSEGQEGPRELGARTWRAGPPGLAPQRFSFQQSWVKRPVLTS